MKLTASVGRMGVNRKHDVALVQKILKGVKVKTRFGTQPIRKGPADGRYMRDMEGEIACLQGMARLRETGKLEPTTQTMNAINRIVPPQLRNLSAMEGTTSVFATGKSNPNADRVARDIETKAPFPKTERKALADAVRKVGKETGYCIKRKRDFITPQGNFATEMGFDSSSVAEAGTGPDAKKAVTKILGNTNGWSALPSPPMACKSKLQLKCLQNIGNATLTTDDKNLLGLTTLPTEPILKSLTKGCARLIASGRLAKQNGKAEGKAITEAVSSANKQLGVALIAALSISRSTHKMEDVARFVFDEMKKNADTSIANAIRVNNKLFQSRFLSKTFVGMFPQVLAIPASAKITAYASWAAMVGPGRSWDFKNSNSPAFNFVAPKHPVTKDPQRECFDPLTSLHYNVDIWGNINYGFVGRAVGFTRDELLSGAGAAQTKTIRDAHKQKDDKPLKDAIKRVEKAQPGNLIKAIDDPRDQVAVKIGMDFWEQAGLGLSFSTFLSVIRLEGSRLHTRR